MIVEVEGLVEGVVVLEDTTACLGGEGEEDGSPGVIVDEVIVAVVCKQIILLTILQYTHLPILRLIMGAELATLLR